MSTDMSEWVKYLILASSVAVLVISFGIGWWAQKKVTSPEAFFGGAKIFGPLTVGLATMAAVGSAFAVVGVPGLVYSTGNTILLFMFAAPGFVFGYLVIGKKVRAMAEIDTKTTAAAPLQLTRDDGEDGGPQFH